jgi:23S rRNA pseudouridine2604 synthase
LLRLIQRTFLEGAAEGPQSIDTGDSMESAEPKRLARVVATLVPCSRREAEQYIAEGWVRVDGQCRGRAAIPRGRTAAGRGRSEGAPAEPRYPATLLMHKPAGMSTAQAQALVGAASHWSGDLSGIRRIKSHGVGLVTLLALPPEASGLTVFSQDRSIVRRLQEDAAADRAGTDRGGGRHHRARRPGAPVPRPRVRGQGAAAGARELAERGAPAFRGKGIAPEIVPWMCAQVGLEITALKRIRIGRVPMATLPARPVALPCATGERF